MKGQAVYLRLLGYLRPYLWPRFAGAMVCMIVFSATGGVVPFLVRHVFDGIFSEKDRFALVLLPPLIVGTFLLRGLAGFGHIYLSDYVGQRIIADLRCKFNSHLQRMSLAFFHRHPTGTLLSRMTNDVALVRAALTGAVASGLRDATSLIVLVGVAFYMDWVLALFAFVVFPAAVLPLVRLSQGIRVVTHRGQVSLGRLTAILQETIQGNRVVKAFGMEGYEESRFAAENERLRRLAMKASRIRAMTAPGMEVLAAVGIAAVVWYGGASVIGGSRTQGSFFAFLTAVGLLYEPFKRLVRANTAVQQGVAAAERIFEVLDAESDIRERPGALSVNGVRRAIEFRDVSFAFRGEPVLRRINLAIPAGQVVALVGPSGAGKSTLADLIPRFYDPSAGRITVDGVDLRDLSLAAWRSQVALVTQDTFLFNDTVRNNIAYGDLQRPMADIVGAARAANAHDFISALPQGYDTPIGEFGLSLSGGERQRLAIARALLKNAPVLILDEATSSLDAEAERLVQDALDRLMAGRTVLVIAHRLSTVRRADRIAVLVRGEIVEEGTHAELVASDTHYRRLYSLQFEDDALQPGKVLH